MRKVLGSFALLSLAVMTNVSAQTEGIDANRVYFGGGLNANSLPGVGSARGFQFFAGYDFNFVINEDILTAVEIGYMDSGDFDRINLKGNFGDATGVWAAAVESVPAR